MPLDLPGASSQVTHVPLWSFLACCHSGWGERDLQKVQRKLAAIGVSNVKDLLRLLNSETLNSRLDSVGERRFADETLRSMRATAAQLGDGDGDLHSRAAAWPSDDTDDVIDSPCVDARPPQTPMKSPTWSAPAPSSNFSRSSEGWTDVQWQQPHPPRHPLQKPGTAPCSGGRGLGARRRFGKPSLSRTRFTTSDWQGGTEGGSSGSDDGGSHAGQPKSGRASLAKAAAVLRSDYQSAGMFASSVHSRKQVLRGIQTVEKAAKEARRRDREVARCLADVQADIERVTAEMHARKRDQYQQNASKAYAPMQGKKFKEAFAATSNRRHSASSFSRTVQPEDIPRPPSGPRASTAPASFGRRLRVNSNLRGTRDQKPPPAAPADGASPSAQVGSPSQPSAESGAPPGSTPGYCQQSGKNDKPAEDGANVGDAYGVGSPAPPSGIGVGNDDESERPRTARLVDEMVASEACRAVHVQLSRLRYCPEADRRASIKRLLVEWHPDRNPDCVELATTVFQYIQQEKDKVFGKL